MGDMSAVHDDPAKFSWEDYIRLTRVSDREYELYDGEVLLMTSPSRRHDVLTARIFNQLYQAFGSGDGPCEVYTHSRKLRTAETAGFQPDVYVRCGPPDHDLWDADARFVIEVLSPSNDAADRTRRLFGYLALDSVESILFVDQAKKVVIVHERLDGLWRERQLIGGEVWLGPAMLDFDALWPWLDTVAALT